MPIIFNNPRDRYVVDISDLPYFIDVNDNKKYILNICDHFSKMAKGYLLSNKKAINILSCIEDFIRLYGKPKSIGSDNGREFKNKIINDYMIDPFSSPF